MRKLVSFAKSLVLIVLVNICTIAKAQDTVLTQQKANEWFDSGSWKSGLQLKGDASIDKVVFAQQYHKNKAEWEKAFAFMRDSDLAKLKPGKYVIDGKEVYATVTEGPEKTFDQSTWESHRKYIDLQYVIKGKEKIGVAPVSSATIIKPYNETSDGANYTAEGQYYIAEPGAFFLFFPGDAHRPNIKVDGYDVVKKMVIKIRVVN